MTVGGVSALEIAKNASGEIHDFAAGSSVRVEERTPFSGGKRVLVDGVLTRRETAVIAATGYFVTAACGAAIVLFREPAELGLGVLGLACAYFYNAPPVRLSYRGLGEIAVGICYGPLIACGAYLVQRGTISRSTPGASMPAQRLALVTVCCLPQARGWVRRSPNGEEPPFFLYFGT